MSAIGGKADMPFCTAKCPLLTQSGHGLCTAVMVLMRFQPCQSEFEPIQCHLLNLGSTCRRRKFITLLGGVAAWPLVARAQQRGRLPTIGFLGAATPADATPWLAAFVKRLGELGWIEGSTIAIEYRWAESRSERYAEIAAELVRLKVDVIVTWASAPVLAAKQATQAIPSSLPRRWTRSAPVSSLAWRVRAATSPDCRSSRPIRPASVWSFCARSSPVSVAWRSWRMSAAPGAVIEMREIAATARALDLDVILLEIQRVEDIAPAIEALKTRADALYVATDPARSRQSGPNQCLGARRAAADDLWRP